MFSLLAQVREREKCCLNIRFWLKIRILGALNFAGGWDYISCVFRVIVVVVAHFRGGNVASTPLALPYPPTE